MQFNLYIPHVTDPILFSRSWLAFAPPAVLELYGHFSDLSIISLPTFGAHVTHFIPPHHHTETCRKLQCYSLSKEGSLLAVAFENGDIEVRSTSTGELLSAGSSAGVDKFLWLAFSQDGKYIIGEVNTFGCSDDIRLYGPCPGATTISLELIPITPNLARLLSITFEGNLLSLLSDPDSLSLALGITPPFSHPITVDLPFGQESYFESFYLRDTLQDHQDPDHIIFMDLFTTSGHLVGTKVSSVSYMNPPAIKNNGESLFLLPNQSYYGEQWDASERKRGYTQCEASFPAAGGVLVFGGRCIRHHRRTKSEDHLDITIINFRKLQSVCNRFYSRCELVFDSHYRTQSSKTPNSLPGGATPVPHEDSAALTYLAAPLCRYVHAHF